MEVRYNELALDEAVCWAKNWPNPNTQQKKKKKKKRD